jgi:dihydrofolate reductase
VDGVEQAVALAREAAGDKDVSLMGGADVIRQGLAAGYVDELTLTIAPLTLGGGKRLFEGFGESVEFEPVRTRQSPFATHITYRVVR